MDPLINRLGAKNPVRCEICRARKQLPLDFYVTRDYHQLTLPFFFWKIERTGIFFISSQTSALAAFLSPIHPGEGHIDYFFFFSRNKLLCYGEDMKRPTSGADKLSPYGVVFFIRFFFFTLTDGLHDRVTCLYIR